MYQPPVRKCAKMTLNHVTAKDCFRSAKNVVFCLLRTLVDGAVGGYSFYMPASRAQFLVPVLASCRAIQL